MDDLIAAGKITSPEWQAAWRLVPRHVFVPRIIRVWPPEDSVPDGLPIDRDHTRERWLRTVYSDRLLMIVDDGERQSSSSMPGMMQRFLDMLDVRDGNSVLEIGTGSGYNAALLCARLGSEKVTTMDIDPELVKDAREALATVGYTPTLEIGDGYFGWPPGAPFDRIIATCAVPRIPDLWLDQVASDGVLVAPLLNHLLVGLRRQPEGSFVGRCGSAGFMPLRSPALPMAEGGDVSSDEVAVRPLGNWFTRFLSRPASVPNLFVQLTVPDIRFGGRWDSDGAGGEDRLLTGREDGSWARVSRADGGYVVTQCGRRRMWDLYEAAVEEWMNLDLPFWTRYGMTVTPDRRQFIWLDDPASDHVWELH